MEKRIELGSEFNLSLNNLQIVENNLIKYLNEYQVQWFDYGRSAIKQIHIEAGRTVLLPEYICESVISCFSINAVKFYRVNENLDIDFEDLFSKIDERVGCIYIAHYFGYLQNQSMLNKVEEISKSLSITIIEDTTQSLFSEHVLCGDYAVASVRKWMPTPMGGVLYIKRSQEKLLPPLKNGIKPNRDNSRAYAMILKDMFLESGYDTNAKYREIFASVERNIDKTCDCKTISDFAHFLIKCYDVNELIHRRKINAKRLQSGLSKLGINGIREFQSNEVPLVYPLRVKKRDEFRSYLMDNRIYCAVHWPFDGVQSAQRSSAIRNAETLISLPIDQRYGEDEIDYMLEVISQYGGELSF